MANIVSERKSAAQLEQWIGVRLAEIWLEIQSLEQEEAVLKEMALRLATPGGEGLKP